MMHVNEATIISIQDKIQQFTNSKNNTKIRHSDQSSETRSNPYQFNITEDSYVVENPKSVDIGPHIKEFNEIYEKYGYLISKYYENSLFTLYNYVKTIVDWCESGNSNDEEVLIKLIETICKQLKMLHEKCEKNQEEEIRKNTQAELKLIENSQKEIAKHKTPEKTIEKRDNEPSQVNKQILPHPFSSQILKLYAVGNNGDTQTRTEPQLTKVEHQDSEATKKTKLKLRILINNIISQVTTENSKHTISRMRHLGQLLFGGTVKCIGNYENETVSVANDGSLLDFCFNVFIKAILNQAHTQLSCNFESGPVLAACIHSILVIVSYKRINLLPPILAELGKYHGPILLMNYGQIADNKGLVNQKNSQSSTASQLSIEEYRGAARLLGCLAVSRPAPLFPKVTHIHPHIGPGLVWITLAHISTLLSAPGLTEQRKILASEVICGLLETSGNALLTTYGADQMGKLLKGIEFSLMNNKVFPIENKDDENGSMSALGACMKIEELLNGKLEEDGRLPADFWFK